MIRHAVAWRIRVYAVGCICVVVAACPSTSHVHHGNEPAGASEASSVLFDVELSYVVEEDAGPREIHTPMVRARVAGINCRLIIDSGATDPVFTRAFAERIGVSLSPTEPGTDHAGTSVASWIFEGTWSLTIDEWRREIKAPLLIDGPPAFEGWDICGFLSPQELHPDATVMIDLRRQRLMLIDGTIDESRITDLDDFERLLLPRPRAIGDAARLLLIEGLLGESRVRVMLNTGGIGAEFSPSTLHSSLEDEQSEVVDVGRGLSGAAVRGVRRRGETLALGEHSIWLREILVREQGESYEGQLGMQILQGTILVISADASQPIRWWRESYEVP